MFRESGVESEPVKTFVAAKKPAAPTSKIGNKLGKTHIEKVFFLSGRTTKILPSLHQWLSGLLKLKLLKQPDFRKKSGFLFSGQGGLPSPQP